MRLSSRAFLETAAERSRRTSSSTGSRANRRPDRAHRRPGGPLDSALAAGQAELAAARLDALLRAVRRPALCRAAAPRHGGRARDRAGACSISPIARGLPLVATNEPFFAEPRRLRGA